MSQTFHVLNFSCKMKAGGSALHLYFARNHQRHRMFHTGIFSVQSQKPPSSTVWRIGN